LNDFDETLPGPFEWDVKRLAASITVAAPPCAKTALRHFGGLMAIRILFNSMQKVTEYCGEKG
jgi:uncharacterized protein (DUF2252 family)